MEKFCKLFDFREVLDSDDPYVLDDPILSKFVKLYGTLVREGMCSLNGSPCNYIKNIGKVSFVLPLTMAVCKKYE